MQRLGGLVSLVTGGASGFGLSTAERLIKHGGKVVLCDINASKGQEAASRLGDNCIFVPTDVTSESDVQKALSTCTSKFEKLDLLVNCAGTNLLSRTYDRSHNILHNLDDFIGLLKVNTVGTFNVTRLAAGLMAKNVPTADNQKGVVVNLTSIHAFEGSVGHVAFATSSGCIAAMTLPLARDLSSEGIRVCSIAAGLFDTPYIHSLPEKYQRFIPNLPPFPKGLGNTQEFAHMVQTIVENRMLNGEVIRLDAALRFDL